MTILPANCNLYNYINIHHTSPYSGLRFLSLYHHASRESQQRFAAYIIISLYNMVIPATDCSLC